MSHLQESPDHKTYFVKMHATYPALLRGAEELLLRMPIRVMQSRDILCRTSSQAAPPLERKSGGRGLGYLGMYLCCIYDIELDTIYYNTTHIYGHEVLVKDHHVVFSA